jgi:hypothetical protein
MSTTPRHRPWREPLVWLVFGLPLASIVAGLGLVATAIRAGGADAVADPVRRTAQVQVAEIGPDARARQRRLAAVLRLGDGDAEVLAAAGDFRRDAVLTLALRHPTRAAADLVVELAPTAAGWRGDTAISRDHDWLLTLQEKDDAAGWRLSGRLHRGERAARLASSLAP